MRDSWGAAGRLWNYTDLLFENMIAYLDASGGMTYYYRDINGPEVDHRRT